MNEGPGNRAPNEAPGKKAPDAPPGEPPVTEPALAARRSARGGASRPRSRARVTPGSGSVPGDIPTAAADRSSGDRSVGLRFARVHLRMGSLALARAELESFAGRGALDEDALLDLAEVRWRTGDLPGAGEAANTLLARGRDDTLALVIAAEAVAALGRPGEARRLAGRALAATEGSLDRLFAGMPRSLIWPADPVGADAARLTGVDEPIATRAARPRPGKQAAIIEVQDAGPASAAAAEAFAGGRAALAGGDLAHAALRLGVALRLEPGFASAVLEAIGDRAAEPGLALVAGDALRLLGRESEALAAFDRARRHPGDGDVAPEGRATPRSDVRG